MFNKTVELTLGEQTALESLIRLKVEKNSGCIEELSKDLENPDHYNSPESLREMITCINNDNEFMKALLEKLRG
jgi:hypothetical protein